MRVPMALFLAIFLVSFNVYVMTVLIPGVVRGLNSTVGNVVTVLVLLSLMTAAFVPTSQNLGEIYGQKKLFTLGLAFFGISMLITIASPNLAVLVVGYSIIGGLAATPLVTVPWIIMNRLFEGWQKDVALLSLSTAAVAGSLTGPFVGGYIATASDWRWAFAPQLVVVIIIWVLIQPVTETERRRDRSLAGGESRRADPGRTL